ncbi:MAG: biopolymer transporter ExbD, partial [Candidatus Hydrogenedentota bacterium]
QKNIVIFVDNKGNIYVNDNPVGLGQLPTYLEKMPNKDKKVIIKGDKKANYQTIISVMDAVHKAGINHFNLATER